MRWLHALLIMACLSSAGLLVVQQQVRAVRAGYRLGQLEHQRLELVERCRQFETRLQAESRLEMLEERATQLGIALPWEREQTEIIERAFRQ